MTTTEFDDDLYARLEPVARAGRVIHTLGIARPNRIVALGRDGVRVETQRSDEKGTGPQLVPAWMVTVAWRRLLVRGRLSQEELLKELNVKRSAFVCALLAQFDDVEVERARPITLRRLTRL